MLDALFRIPTVRVTVLVAVSIVFRPVLPATKTCFPSFPTVMPSATAPSGTLATRAPVLRSSTWNDDERSVR